MKFSDVQQKELIDMNTGQFIGYVMDAFVDKTTGNIEYFIVEQPKKFYQLLGRESFSRKVFYKQIMAIGQDVILIEMER